jgi:2,4-dienoyl-CoA reductase-like NADH-dependent reductase (Old Yellow Enzyme family)
VATPFDPIPIGGMTLPNRFVRSATWEGLADEAGAATSRLDEMMAELARGEVGLIITGYAFVSPEGRSSNGQLAIHDDRFIPSLREMAQAVHSAGGKIALQLVHGGAFAKAELNGLEAVGPSAGGKGALPACRPLSPEAIKGVVAAFRDAAARAKEAGFEAVQVHAAHGYLLSQFLSPALNERTDGYGGALMNRARLLLEVVRGIREATGSRYPILVKLNSEDFLEGGLMREEAVRVAQMLEGASVDAIELSGGTVVSPEALLPARPGALKKEREVYYREAAHAYKQAVAVPLMLVGGIRSFEVADELVRAGTADCIALSRPLIREPGLVRRWREGDRRKATCGSCNECFGPALEGRGVHCVSAEKGSRENRA